MTLTVMLPLLAAAALASAASMAWSVAGLRPGIASAAAAAFALLLMLVALLANRSLWRLPADRITPAAAPMADVRNAALMALAYGWGAAALVAIYTLSGLDWRHGLQYAAGMGVIALLIAAYARALSHHDSRLRLPHARRVMPWITVLHAAAAASGVGYLFASGKLRSAKGDWAANIVFLIGGLTVLTLSVIAAVTQHRLSRRP